MGSKSVDHTIKDNLVHIGYVSTDPNVAVLTNCFTTYYSPSPCEEEEPTMRRLYEVYFVNKKTLEVKKTLRVADSSKMAYTLAVLEFAIPAEELSDWVDDVYSVMDVPEVE
jgi:hypothetical protein